MAKLPWKPWHEVVTLRDDLKSGELSLQMFAADLYEVLMRRGKMPVYEKPENFFALTFPTHTLITLHHLASDPDSLPDLPAVAEFKQSIGEKKLPKARVAGLCFDKLDVEKGMEVRGPDGKSRRLKHPWSVLAYQLAGNDGLKLLHAEGRAEERETAPAE